MYDEDDEESVRKVADNQFTKHLFKTALVGTVKMISIPAFRVSCALTGAFMLHWGVGLAYIALGALVFRKLPNYVKMSREASASGERPEKTPTEAADEADEAMSKINGMPKGVLPKVSLLITSLLCGAFAWNITGNGGAAVLLFVLALLSPWANANIVRKTIAEYGTIMRFMDMSRRPDTPEI